MLLAFLALGTALPAQAPTEPASQAAVSNPNVRIPTGRWFVDFADAQCVASRDYGTSTSPLILGLKAPAVGDLMQVLIIRAGRARHYADQIDVEIAIDGRVIASTTLLATRMAGQDDRRLYQLNLPLDQFSAIRAGNILTVEAGREFTESFELSGIEPLVKVMDDCVADLRSVWNAPGEDRVSPIGGKRASGNLAKVIRSEDYPQIAITDYSGGEVAFLLLIDESGRVADCTVTQTSGVAILDAQSCAIIKERARFEPATDPDGRPVKDVYHQRIRWQVQ